MEEKVEGSRGMSVVDLREEFKRDLSKLRFRMTAVARLWMGLHNVYPTK
jgi:hypothetical protein